MVSRLERLKTKEEVDTAIRTTEDKVSYGNYNN